MNHANDNRSPEEHRAYVASLRASQGDQEVRARNRNWPTFGRLKRANAWLQIQALERFADDEGVSLPEGMMHAANDNTPRGDFDLPEISRVDGRMDEEMPDGDDIMDAWLADEKDRKEGRPEKATRIQFCAYGRITAVKTRGRYRSLEETFSTPHGPAQDTAKISINAGYSMPDELPDAEDDAARRMDHEAMKRRLGPSTCRLLELALGDATSEEIGEIQGAAGKTAERIGVRAVDEAIGKLMAAYAARDAADREAA